MDDTIKDTTEVVKNTMERLMDTAETIILKYSQPVAVVSGICILFDFGRMLAAFSPKLYLLREVVNKVI